MLVYGTRRRRKDPSSRTKRKRLLGRSFEPKLTKNADPKGREPMNGSKERALPWISGGLFGKKGRQFWAEDEKNRQRSANCIMAVPTIYCKYGRGVRQPLLH